MLNIVELQYKLLSISINRQYYFCQDSEFRSTMGTSSVDNEFLLWLSRNRFICTIIMSNYFGFFLTQRWCRPKDGDFFLVSKVCPLELFFLHIFCTNSESWHNWFNYSFDSPYWVWMGPPMDPPRLLWWPPDLSDFREWERASLRDSYSSSS